MHRARVGLGLSLQVTHAQHSPFSRVFDRLPVLIGRNDGVASCALPDAEVSRLHASIDIRDGLIRVRDAGSRNGTFVSGKRIPPDCWVTAGERTCTIRVAEWSLMVTTCEVAAAPPAEPDDFLASIPELLGGLRPNVVKPTAQPLGGATELAPGPMFQVGRAWGRVVLARQAMIDTLHAVIQELTPEERLEFVREVVHVYPELVREPAVRPLFEGHGRADGVGLSPSLESAALTALQGLARWYVSDAPPLANSEQVFTFARKLKAGIDELLLGTVPMFAGLDRFEDQMALRPAQSAGPPASTHLPRTPGDAARALFDWRDPTDKALRAVRTDLVDLMMHQVAVLNGVMRGVKELLAELAPATIAEAAKARAAQGGFFARTFASAVKERWEMYCERHGDLADEENERFRVIFGPEFVAEYKQSGRTDAR